MPSTNHIMHLEQLLATENLPWQKRIATIAPLFTDVPTAFSTSFSMEDQLITHLLVQEKAQARIFTLDTGRLFEETLTLQQNTAKHYNISIESYYPDAVALEAYVKDAGINGFYTSVEKRKQCCHIRKVEPLQRALKGVAIWISGLRREHSGNRHSFPIAEWDESTGTLKYYPLIDMVEAELEQIISAENIPINPLYRQGYRSIGCAPCTRPTEAHEHPRDGRWWWENKEAQECGLHISNGRLIRHNAHKNIKERLHAH